MTFLTRIAPTPSGFLHEGNAFSFLLTAQLATALNAKILLRIDDLDAERKRPEFVHDIFESLGWLGIKWQIGPQNLDELERKWSQHQRIEDYNKVLKELCDLPDLLYVCTCSRKELNTRECHCKKLNLPVETPDSVWRAHIPERTFVQFTDGIRGQLSIPLNTTNPVLRRRDGLPAYQITSLIDDVNHGITHIVRGEDLLYSTALQRWLAEKLGLNTFFNVQFFHHTLLKDENGNKLSKSAGSVSLRDWRLRNRSVGEFKQRMQRLLDSEWYGLQRSF